jgi:L-histidine Nalpha-methyltransferase
MAGKHDQSNPGSNGPAVKDPTSGSSRSGQSHAGTALEGVSRIVRRLRADGSEHAIGIWETRTTGRLGFVMRGLKSKRNGRHIEDGYQYVGGFPADMWRIATGDQKYKTLSYGIKTFPQRWSSLQQQVTHPIHYLSIGPGTGEKDNLILKYLQELAADRSEPLVYMPVDISADLLKMSFDQSMKDIDERRIELVPMELDISAKDAIKTLNTLRPAFPGGGGVLVSVLGNTIANFRDDHSILNHLSHLLTGSDDVLLLELATTTAATEELAEIAEEEYEGSTSFRDFVMAALSQYTDCIPSSGEVTWEATVKKGRLEITTLFVSEKDLVIHLTDGDTINLKAGETIKLYKSRKYTTDALTLLLDGFGQLDEERTQYEDAGEFGVVTKLLTCSDARPGPRGRWSSHPAAG